MRRKNFEQFGLVSAYTEHDKVFHMLITDGFDESKTIHVMSELARSGIMDEYPILVTNVTDDKFFDIVLIK
jgi:hypothetical protein